MRRSGAKGCLLMHMRDGCLRLLRLRPDLIHKSPLHLETAFRARYDALLNDSERQLILNPWRGLYYRGRGRFVKERAIFRPLPVSAPASNTGASDPAFSDRCP